MRKLTKPLKGAFAAVTPSGHIWMDTIRFRARDTRKACGEMLVGRKLPGGATVDSAKAGWGLALSEGFHVERVDISASHQGAR